MTAGEQCGLVIQLTPRGAGEYLAPASRSPRASG